ncbi:hypothetical protein [Bacillus alveayuensis]|jgi:hypothetical protein|uniref:Abortive phage infection protein n=1 Tax=Aeribacillus alveayuensis TaxID=279215 RepID=A0ABT9VN35_9BACI|nr:hypothetical protein [Bacillus alveayuensis]MDQ0162242.1 hypothetical protein [Bacillus alveayuensis]
MDEKLANDILDKLKDGELNEYLVTKEQFMIFRKVLVSRPDFKHFRGIAQRGGNVIYQYLQDPRS